MSLIAGSIQVELDAIDKGFKKGFKEAESGLTDFEKKAKEKNEKIKEAGNSMVSGLANTAKMASLAIGAGFLAFGAGVFSATADAQTLFIALKSSLGGSEELAKTAQKQITKFAEKTPYDLQQVTESFIKLKNLGLDPSDEALTAYGNTASSMGKSLSQMIEAVADASVGEFERLKEFGIKASKEGDNVAFTFQGVTTNIKNNSGDIQKYLMDIGNTKFAGAMDEQSRSISGTMSTMTDTIKNKMVDIGKALKIDERLPQFIQSMSEKIAQIDIQPLINGFQWISDNGNTITVTVASIAGAFTGLGIALLTFNIMAAGASIGAVGLIPSLLALASAGWLAVAPFLPFILIGALVAGVIALIVMNWESIKTWASTNWTMIGKWITETWTSVSTATGNFLNWFGSKISEAWNWVTTTTTNVWNGITSFFTAIWDGIIKTISAVFLTIYGLFTGNDELLSQVWEKFWKGIVLFLYDGANKIKQGFIDFTESAKKSIVDFTINAVKSFFEFWQKSREKTEETKKWILDSLANLWNSVVQGIQGFGQNSENGMKEAMNKLGAKIWETMVWIMNIDMAKIGQDMIQGMINGVKNMGNNLKNALGDVVNGAVNSAKSTLGIQSPSKVFYEIGGYTMEGMENGITENMSMPIQAINQATTAVIQDPVNQVVASQGQSQNANQGNLTVNLNGNYLGTERDKRQLARDFKDAFQSIILDNKTA